MKKISIALMMLLIALPAHAEFFFLTGYELASYMEEYEKSAKNHSAAKTAEANAFVGYVTGVFETLSGLRRVCTKSTTTSHITSVVATYLKDNPERWSGPAIYPVAEALEAAFPCKK